MVGMIFAAGYGTRLKPWTDTHPKALVDVGGMPALSRVIERMREAGVSHVVVNTHHFAEQIHTFIAASGYGSFVRVSHEPVLLDTGGGLSKALPLIGDEPVLIHNVDIMTDFDLRQLIARHQEAEADATLLTDVRRTTRFLVFDDATEHLCGYYKSECGPVTPDEITLVPTGCSARCFDGIHIVSPRLYPLLRDYAPAGEPFSIIAFYRSIQERAAICRHDLPAGNHWFDVGKPETLLLARNFFDSLK